MGTSKTANLVLWLMVGLVGFSPAQTVTTLYSFPKNGGLPRDLALVQGRDGQLYGTTSVGGLSANGTVFKISTAGVTHIIYSFDSTNGALPIGGLTLASDGSFYGAAFRGGSGTQGVLFKVSQNGSEQDLVNLGNGSGTTMVPPVQFTDGNFYGSTEGIAPSVGTLYRFTPTGAFTTLYNFDPALGSYPVGKLLEGANNRMYGVASGGGSDRCGSIFEFTLGGSQISTYNFDCVTGNNPVGALIQASDGNFYGAADEGGTHGLGVIYKLDQHGVYAVLYNFGDTSGDNYPTGALMQATDGNLYGTASNGGIYHDGTIFQITLQGVYTRIYDFPALADAPQFAGSGLVQGTDGAIYGESQLGGTAGTGTIYRLDMGLGPFITFVLPVGKVGHSAQILGQGLSGTTRVTFNGIPATSFTAVSDTFMTAIAPSGATTGPVVVTTPTGALTSNVKFRIQ